MLEDSDALDFLVTYGGDMYYQVIRNGALMFGASVVVGKLLKMVVGKYSPKKLKKHLCEDLDL